MFKYFHIDTNIDTISETPRNEIYIYKVYQQVSEGKKVQDTLHPYVISSLILRKNKFFIQKLFFITFIE